MPLRKKKNKKDKSISETEQKARAYPNKEIFRRLSKYLLNQKKKIITLLILSVLVSVTNLSYPLMMAVIVDNVTRGWNAIVSTILNIGQSPKSLSVGDFFTTLSDLYNARLSANSANQEITNLLGSGFLLIIFVFANFIIKWIYQRGMANLSLTAISDIRSDLFSHLQTLSLKYYVNRPAGKIISSLTNDVESVNNLVSNAIIQLIGDLLTVIVTLTSLLIISWELTFFILGFAPLIGGILYAFAKKSREYWRKTRRTISLITSLLQESISGSKTIKAFVTEDQNIENFELAARADREVNLSAARLQAFLSPIISLIIAFSIGLVLIRGADLVASGKLTIPTMVAYILLALGFIAPFSNMTNFYNTIQLAMAGGERILTIFDTNPDIVEPENPVQIPEEGLKGEVEFRNVTFWYEEGLPVLKDINLKTKMNQRVAFVGFTGAGKTTLISLLSRFYDPQEGEILIDGYNIKEYALDDFRSQMGIVLQDTYLFSGSVMDNIRYGKPNATDEEVIEAAKKVGAHKFIRKLVDGYNTQVRERGSLLSVGQRQLISFSRALLANPRILILDEATSSIDPYTELKIQEALETLLKGRNSFVIAHRLSTILNSDIICVLENGKIIQQGSHDELVSQEGLYKHLYEMQFRKPNKSLDEVKDEIIQSREKFTTSS